MYSGIMRKDDNRTSKSLSGRSVTYKLSGFIIKTGTRITVPCFLLFSLRLMEALHFLAEFFPSQEN